MKNAAIILVRSDSKRLPKKYAKNLGNRKLLEWPILALQKAGIEVIISTTERSIDDRIIDIAHKHKIKFFRGDLLDVSKRYAETLKKYNLEYSFRINGDSPFINQKLVKSTLKIISTQKFDLVTNLIDRSYPYGISLEVIKSSTFLNNYNYFNTYQKEHITNYFYINKDNFNIKKLTYKDNIPENMRFVVDTYEDLTKLNSIVAHNDNVDFNCIDIKDLIKIYLKND